MVDIHTHILPMIDDGSQSLEDSLEMIASELKNNVKHIFITPHLFRKDIEEYSLEFLREEFNKFRTYVEERDPVKLYLGQEIYLSSDLITRLKKKDFLTMNKTDYILLELPYDYSLTSFEEVLHACNILGLKIVLAHIERYSYFNLKDLEDLASNGVLFQVNSSSIVSKQRSLKVRVKKLFKKGLVSFVASDLHSFRKNTMLDAYEIIRHKYGETIANDVFSRNAKKLFKII